MQPDDDGTVEAPSGLLGPLLKLVHPSARVKAHAEPVRPLDLESVKARSGHARGRIPRRQKPRRQVRAAVAREIRRNWQGAKVHRVPSRDIYREERSVED